MSQARPRATKKRTPVNIGVGMPAWLLLNQFGRVVFDAFGEWPYLVGSATHGKRWRDIDVRLILADEDFERWCGKLEHPLAANPRWSAFCLAFSYLGEQMTGLPVDFQIQQRTDANKEFPHEDRHALIMCGIIK